MAIDTEEEAISEFLEALKEEPQQPDPKMKKTKLENHEAAEFQNSRSEPYMFTTWARHEHKKSVVGSAYQPPLPFPSQATLSPLEREHREFVKHVKGIPINNPFVESLSKTPEHQKLLQDLIDTCKQLKKQSKVVLSEQSSKAVLGETPEKMGDPGRLTLPCEFVMDMKEDPDIPFILGRPLLNPAGALVDIRKSKLTLRVGDEKEVFGIEDGFPKEHFQEEGNGGWIKEDPEEDPEELMEEEPEEDLEELMEEEPKEDPEEDLEVEEEEDKEEEEEDLDAVSEVIKPPSVTRVPVHCLGYNGPMPHWAEEFERWSR
ncbi:uncharacterized protein LOC128126142 [Lactuca sativa]|uniref:uncharacterized protein LOC128126142 n=1 Tax=Lactuca sativa TaxID=4236 RepID=UPI0022AEC644|nr:uncharacterized protein LOC128126142 [Lactuca sativa]